MDDADLSDLTARVILNAQIENARVRGKALPYTSSCHYCGEQIHRAALFCDADCAKDYDTELKRKARLGR